MGLPETSNNEPSSSFSWQAMKASNRAFFFLEKTVRNYPKPHFSHTFFFTSFQRETCFLRVFSVNRALPKCLNLGLRQPPRSPPQHYVDLPKTEATLEFKDKELEQRCRGKGLEHPSWAKLFVKVCQSKVILTPPEQ